MELSYGDTKVLLAGVGVCSTGGGRISRWQMGSAKLFAALCVVVENKEMW